MLQKLGTHQRNRVKYWHCRCECQTCSNVVQNIAILLLHVLFRPLVYLQLLIISVDTPATQFACTHHLLDKNLEQNLDVRCYRIQKEVRQQLLANYRVPQIVYVASIGLAEVADTVLHRFPEQILDDGELPILPCQHWNQSHIHEVGQTSKLHLVRQFERVGRGADKVDAFINVSI